MASVENFEQSSKKSKYNINFRNNVETITDKPYKDGIKLLVPMQIVEFPKNDKEKHKCLCGHRIHKILLFSYDNTLYKIGIDCIEKIINTDMSDEQKEKINSIFEDYKNMLKDIKKEYKIKTKEYEKIMNKYNDMYDDFYFEMNKIKEKEERFLNKPRKWKNEHYSFKTMFDNKKDIFYRKMLHFYYTKYPFDETQKDYLKYLIEKNIIKK